jgi:4-diphosphocytidyl-2-C-methyl-D-erythritol kinase
MQHAPAGGTTQSASEIPAGSENLVIRALERLRERSGSTLGAHVELVKRIPAAAGLGGGSSDAATALRLANSAWDLNWPIAQLVSVAAEVGSDVPFFLHGGPALCFGRGERVTRYSKIPRRWFVFVKPPTGISTAEVYLAHDRLSEGANRQEPVDIVTAAAAFGTSGILKAGRWMFNRLQPAAAAVSPWVERLRTAFGRLDFLGHQLSGSGSAYFGVCRHAQHARRLATILRKQQLGLVYVTHSIA